MRGVFSQALVVILITIQAVKAVKQKKHTNHNLTNNRSNSLHVSPEPIRSSSQLVRLTQVLCLVVPLLAASHLGYQEFSVSDTEHGAYLGGCA
jgi:hypothetical protein